MSTTTCEATEEQRAKAAAIATGIYSAEPYKTLCEAIAQALAQESSRLAGYIREAKHLISVRMEGFPCADGDACENLKTLQGIAAALDGKEI